MIFAPIAFSEGDFSARKYLFAVNGNLKAHANHITMDERIHLTAHLDVTT